MTINWRCLWINLENLEERINDPSIPFFFLNPGEAQVHQGNILKLMRMAWDMVKMVLGAMKVDDSSGGRKQERRVGKVEGAAAEAAALSNFH